MDRSAWRGCLSFLCYPCLQKEKAKALQAVNGLERDLATIERAAKAAADAAKATPEDDSAMVEEELAVSHAARGQAGKDSMAE